ncbi:hypothetical protein J6590_079898 [Homalodisca vitripennis]|nr:hypothetical protein J6590_079898 [Homalodisca vitripennis]
MRYGWMRIGRGVGRGNNTRCLTRRGGGDGSAVARRGDDEARANCLAVTVQQSRGADEARADCLHTYSNNAWCLRGGGTAMTCVIPTITTPAYTMSGRHDIQNREELPGPAAYSPEKIPNIVTPSYSMGGRHQVSNKEEIPGPGAYCPEKVIQRYLRPGHISSVVTKVIYLYLRSGYKTSVVTKVIQRYLRPGHISSVVTKVIYLYLRSGYKTSVVTKVI